MATAGRGRGGRKREDGAMNLGRNQPCQVDPAGDCPGGYGQQAGVVWQLGACGQLQRCHCPRVSHGVHHPGMKIVNLV